MGLDIDFTPYYNLTLPISKKKVLYRPYLVGEEITFLIHLESENPLDLLTAIFDLTKKCVKDISIFDNMNIVDFTYLTAHIRAKSKGEQVEIVKKCPNCNSEITSVFDITSQLKIKNEKNTQGLVTINSDTKIEIGILDYSVILDIFKSELDSEGLDTELLTISSVIKKIIHKGKIYNNMNVIDIYNDVIKKLPRSGLKEIVNEMKKMPVIVGEVSFNCQCGYNQMIEVDNILNFLS